MNCIVDWYSFTVPANAAGLTHSAEAYDFLEHKLETGGGYQLFQLIGGKQGTPRNGRGHYGAGVYYEQFHISVWWGGIADHVLVEIAGVGCEALRAEGLLSNLISDTHSRCTRLDIAIDFQTNVTPSQFCSSGYNERFKSRGTFNSPDGSTEYVGSPKSDRFSRIYRYNKPHPRSEFLRIEAVLRGNYAKAAAKTLSHSDISDLASQLGNSFMWRHPLWNVSSPSDGKLAFARDEKGDASSLFWLARQVKPALIRLGREKVINLEEFFADILSEIE